MYVMYVTWQWGNNTTADNRAAHSVLTS